MSFRSNGAPRDTWLYVYRPDRLPVRIFALDVEIGQRRPLMNIVIPDTTGIDGNVAVVMLRTRADTPIPSSGAC